MKTEEDKFIEWLEFQSSVEIHNVSKMAIKTKLQQYTQQVSREKKERLSNLVDLIKNVVEEL